MSPPRVGRTQDCGPAEATTRLAQAQKFMEVAELVDSEEEIPESVSCAAALAVLCGIAAADAACCKALGKRSRSQNHHDAEALLEQIHPGGKTAAANLRRLINEKDNAHYGLSNVGKKTQMTLMRQAQKLLVFATAVLAR